LYFILFSFVLPPWRSDHLCQSG